MNIFMPSISSQFVCSKAVTWCKTVQNLCHKVLIYICLLKISPANATVCYLPYVDIDCFSII